MATGFKPVRFTVLIGLAGIKQACRRMAGNMLSLDKLSRQLVKRLVCKQFGLSIRDRMWLDW